jgi:hypothetical protein
MKAMRVATCLCAILLAAGGCTVTRDVTTYEQLLRASHQTLRLLAVDRSVYELTRYVANDSTIEGSGIHMVNGDRIPFTGQLAYRDLVYIQMQAGSFWRTVEALGFVGLTASYLKPSMDEGGLFVYRPTSGDASSCPYVYAWNGEGYSLQGEAFGTSFGKGLEAGTICMLPAARSRGEEIVVRVANERPETHYVNRATLLAFEAPAGAEVLVDNENRAWPVVGPEAPAVGPAEVKRTDGTCWSRGTGDAVTAPGYRDFLEVGFARPAGARDASLIVRAINTDLVSSAFQLVFGYLGDQALPFLYQVENDPELIRVLKGWIEDCSLVVEFEENGHWTNAGAIAPEASACVFSRIVRVNASGIEGDSLRVRLGSLADGWRIDAVAIDWTEVAPLEAHPMAMRSARDGSGSSMMEALAETDARYAIVLPGGGIVMAFEAYRASGRGAVAYALEAGGYLHEWPAAAEADSNVRFPVLPEQFGKGSERLAVVNVLVRNRDMLLPLVYDFWRQRGRKAAG